MKFLAALGALSLGAGCGHVDVSPEANRSRVLAGTVNVGQALPAGSEILVRIVVPAGGNMTVKTGSDIPVVRPNLTGGEQILGEFVQTLAAPAGEAVPFKIEFDAEDALLRRGVNLEARVYFNGRVRFRTVNAHAVTVNSAHFPQTLFLQAVAR
jgi:hypothetical protein